MNDVEQTTQALAKRLWVKDALIPEAEAEELVKPVLNEHWHLIKAINAGAAEPDLAYVKLDPLTIAASIFGVMQPKTASLEDVAACFVEKYYPEIDIK